MKKRQKLLTDEQWELIEPLFPEPTAQQGQSGPTVGVEPGVFRGHSVDSANRGGVAISARRVSLAVDLLAAAEAVGRGRRLAGCVANSAGRAGRRRPAEVGRNLPGRQLRPGEKGGAAVGKTKRGKGTKWMVLVDGQGLPLGVRLESASPAEVTLAEPRSQKSASRDRKAARGKSRSASSPTAATTPIRCGSD